MSNSLKDDILRAVRHSRCYKGKHAKMKPNPKFRPPASVSPSTTISELQEIIKKQGHEIRKLNVKLSVIHLENRLKSIRDRDQYLLDFVNKLKDEVINNTAYACDSSQHSGYYDYQMKVGDLIEFIDSVLDTVKDGGHINESTSKR